MSSLIPDFISDDWRETPQNIRYFILAGSALLVIVWVANKLDIDTRLSVPLFNGGATLIIFGFFLLVLKQLWVPSKVFYYKRKYPLKDKNIKFFLIRFNNRIILFDKRNAKKKRSYHIHPLQTARDLHFNHEALPISQEYDTAIEGDAIIGTPDTKIYLKVGDYKYRGQINTSS